MLNGMLYISMRHCWHLVILVLPSPQPGFWVFVPKRAFPSILFSSFVTFSPQNIMDTFPYVSEPALFISVPTLWPDLAEYMHEFW